MTTSQRTAESLTDGGELLEQIRREASRIEEDALHSSKGHFEAERIASGRHLLIGIPTTVLAATIGVIAKVECEAVTVGLTAAVAVGSALITFLDPKARAAQHFAAGTQFNALRSEARMFREIECRASVPLESLKKRIGELNRKRAELNASAPPRGRRTFEKARDGIRRGEAAYEVDRVEPVYGTSE